MPKNSAGILLYRFNAKNLEVLLVHPGGPYWAKKEVGAWSIPKGEIEPQEDFLQAAIRETQEETGIKAQGKFIPLTSLKQKSGKIIHIWALQGNVETSKIRSNSFEMEWPPRSGHKKVFPEIDKANWFSIVKAQIKIVPGQLPFLIELEKLVNGQRREKGIP